MRRSSLLVLRDSCVQATSAVSGVQDERSVSEAREEIIEMAARAIWKGSIDLGRTELPVKLYSAVEDRAVHFHLLEKRTHARVKQHMVNPSTSKEVRTDEVRKGYEVEPDTFVIVDDSDLQKIEPEPSTSIEVTSFLPEGRIGQQYYDRPYFLGPD